MNFRLSSSFIRMVHLLLFQFKACTIPTVDGLERRGILVTPKKIHLIIPSRICLGNVSSSGEHCHYRSSSRLASTNALVPIKLFVVTFLWV